MSLVRNCNYICQTKHYDKATYWLERVGSIYFFIRAALRMCKR